MKPNEWGDFLAGTLAPLAFIWFVFGYYQQSKELEQNTKALELQAEELRAMVGAQNKNVEIASKSLELEIGEILFITAGHCTKTLTRKKGYTELDITLSIRTLNRPVSNVSLKLNETDSRVELTEMAIGDIDRVKTTKLFIPLPEELNGFEKKIEFSINYTDFFKNNVNLNKLCLIKYYNGNEFKISIFDERIFDR